MIYQRCVRLPALFLFMLLAALVNPVSADQANQTPVQGQKPLPVMEGSFQVVPGAWASYLIRDRKKDEYYRLYFSTLERVVVEGRQAFWMEVIVKTQGQDLVVTRFLATETTSGPGEILEAIVQPDGYDPFTVPQSFLEDKEKGVGQVGVMKPEQAAAEKKHITYLGRSLDIIKVRAKDAQGRTVSAQVCEQVPPLCLVGAVSPDMEMYLDDWGGGATSQIFGEPMNFYLWLTLQVGKAMGDASTGGGDK